MNIIKSGEGYNAETASVIGILVHESEPETISLDPLRAGMRDFCRTVAINEAFRGKKDSSLVIKLADESVRCVVLYGLGKDGSDCEDAVRAGAFAAVRAAASRGLDSVAVFAPKACGQARSRSVAEGAVLGTYRFNKYIAQEPDDKFKAPDTVTVINGCETGLEEGLAIGGAQCWARDTANEPGNAVSPQGLASRAVQLAEELGLVCEVWDEKKIDDERMGAFAAVGRGSANPPRFIRVSCAPEGECRGHVVLVGKGLTFDSGGLDIKPSEFMLTMKGDKSGACAVLGAMRAIAQLKLPWKVTALVAAAENMPGGNSYRPDDVLRARNGKTIEVNNTDAEGRLTLADALCYASELKPDMIVDIATLTGACAVALGSNTAGLFTNNEALGDKVLAASKASGERFWKMPMDDETLRAQLKSPVADLVNCGSRYGGAITAAMFLEAFVDKDIPWAHLDIAAADFIKEPRSYYVKGASGFGARTLVSLIMNL